MITTPKKNKKQTGTSMTLHDKEKRTMSDTEAKKKSVQPDASQKDLEDPIIDKLENFMDKVSQIDVNTMVNGINQMVAEEEKDR